MDAVPPSKIAKVTIGEHGSVLVQSWQADRTIRLHPS